jgi:hypothetical protein
VAPCGDPVRHPGGPPRPAARHVHPGTPASLGPDSGGAGFAVARRGGPATAPPRHPIDIGCGRGRHPQSHGGAGRLGRAWLSPRRRRPLATRHLVADPPQHVVGACAPSRSARWVGDQGLPRRRRRQPRVAAYRIVAGGSSACWYRSSYVCQGAVSGGARHDRDRPFRQALSRPSRCPDW